MGDTSVVWQPMCWHMWPVGDEGCHEWALPGRHGCGEPLGHDTACRCKCGHVKEVQADVDAH